MKLSSTARTFPHLRTIRNAGLGRVKAQAARQGISTVEKDIQTLRWVANGSTNQAAAKRGVDVATVCRLIRKYEKIALAILNEDAQCGRR